MFRHDLRRIRHMLLIGLNLLSSITLSKAHLLSRHLQSCFHFHLNVLSFMSVPCCKCSQFHVGVEFYVHVWYFLSIIKKFSLFPFVKIWREYHSRTIFFPEIPSVVLTQLKKRVIENWLACSFCACTELQNCFFVALQKFWNWTCVRS